MHFKKIHIKQLFIKIFFSITIVILSNVSFAQDLHFSQFYNSPLTCNPANTGFMPDADYRVGMNYRRQWATVPVPYKTMSVFGDVQVSRNKLQNGWFGAGGMLLRDEAGTGALLSTKVYGSLAYHQIIGEANLLSVGFQAGLVQKSINPTKLTFDNQWNGKFFDVDAPSGENFASLSVRYADLNAGISYSAFPTEESYLNFGLSLQHLNKPKETFFSEVLANGNNYDNKLSRRYTAFFNGSFKLNDLVIVNPQAYASYMAKAVEINAGVNIQYNLSGDGASQLIGGVYYRHKDALIPMLGIKHKSITATFTYDATVSKLSPFNKIRGGSEISIIHNGIFVNNRGPRDTRCKSPSF
jgi:type IX secretion system PorP/SprF family membrane protein